MQGPISPPGGPTGFQIFKEILWETPAQELLIQDKHTLFLNEIQEVDLVVLTKYLGPAIIQYQGTRPCGQRMVWKFVAINNSGLINFWGLQIHLVKDFCNQATSQHWET